MAAQLIQNATAQFGGILQDVFIVAMAIVNILIVLTAFRIIYALIKQESIIPQGMFLSAEEKEYRGILDQEEERYRVGSLHERAKNEILEKHKHDDWT